MKTYESTVYSIHDSFPLSVLTCIPDEVKGIVQISHGMAEHKERYLPFMEFLCQHGFACVIHDHRGHGKSVKDRKDLGYFYEENATAIVEDLLTVSSSLRKQYTDVPFTLFAHSMGSLVALKYIQKYDGSLNRLILCGLPCKNALASVGIGIVRGMEVLFSSHYRSRFVSYLATGSYGKGSSWLSKSVENQKVYDADPDCGFRFTLNGYKNLFTLARDAYRSSAFSCQNPDLQVVFVAGEKDPVIGGVKKWKASMAFLRQQGYENIRFRLFSSLKHEILNEKERDFVYNNILEYII